MAKVLIVEDDLSLRDVYREAFLQEGFSVETACEGQEGLEKMASFSPDVMLLDLMMPKVSGFDLLEKVKKDPNLKKIPILVTTNVYADEQDLMQNYGVSNFLLKTEYEPKQIVEKARLLIKK